MSKHETLTIRFIDGFGDETHGLFDLNESDSPMSTGDYRYIVNEAHAMQAGMPEANFLDPEGVYLGCLVHDEGTPDDDGGEAAHFASSYRD